MSGWRSSSQVVAERVKKLSAGLEFPQRIFQATDAVTQL